MAVDHCPAVARQMLDHRRHAASEQSIGVGPRQQGHQLADRRRTSGCRSPRSCRPWPTSRTGAQSTSIPTSRRSWAISRPSSRAASQAPSTSLAASRPISAADGSARQCGGRSRITRPPSWSIEHRQRAIPGEAVQLVGQRPELSPIGAVALEQDDPGRRQGQEQRALGVAERRPGHADDGRAGREPQAHAGLTVRSARR